MTDCKWYFAAITVGLLLLPSSAAAQDNCHGRDPEQDSLDDKAAVLACIKAGGISGVSIFGDDLAFAIRETTEDVELTNVELRSGWNAKDAAFKWTAVFDDLCQSPPAGSNIGICHADEKRMAKVPNNIRFVDVEVTGNWMQLSGVAFEGTVSLTRVRAPRLNLSGSIFAKGLTLDHVEAEDGLEVDGVASLGPVVVDGATAKWITASGLDALDGLRMVDVGSQSFSMSDTSFVGGALVLDGMNIGQAWIYEVTVTGDITIRNSTFGPVAKGETLPALGLFPTDFDQRLTFDQTKVLGELSIDSSVYEGAP